MHFLPYLHFSYLAKNGILRYLYNLYGNEYYETIVLDESDHFSNFIVRNAFDFNFSGYSYWGSNTNQGYFSVCFPFHYLTIESFEITTTSHQCRPIKFAAEVSENGRNYKGYQEYNYAMGISESQKFSFSYNTNFVRCFRLYTLQSACAGSSGSDIEQIEFFGNFFEINLVQSPKPIYLTCCYGRYFVSIDFLLIFSIE